ncbi:MAG: Trp biosynthesis-associated membrane protein [Pseudonocardiaceae bacterium]
MNRRALIATVVLLLGAAAAFGGAAALGWARVGFQAPLRGSVPVQVNGSDLLPVLSPLALLALASVAAVLATGGWVRRLLGALLVVAAVPTGLGVARVTDQSRLVGAAVSAGGRADRAVADGTVTLLPAGPVLTVIGAVLLAGAGVALVLWGHRMPRMGSRYRTPAARASRPEELWERIDAGEDPTAQGDPR